MSILVKINNEIKATDEMYIKVNGEWKNIDLERRTEKILKGYIPPTSGTTYDLSATIPTTLNTGDIINCPYADTIRLITLPVGIYELECWGAKGGGYGSNTLSGGNGGYTNGLINLTSPQSLYLVTGGKGALGGTSGTHAGGYNGGGIGTAYSGGGGGATHIALASGTLSSLYADQTQILLVAGGGAGAASNNTYYRAGEGLGGGTNGTNGLSIMIPNSTNNYTKNFGLGGTQKRAGYVLNDSSICVGSFGQGGNAAGNYSSGGGGGFYGGGGSSNYGTGGGGSGYVNENRIISGYSTVEKNSTNPDVINFNGYIRITVLQAGVESGVYIKKNGEWRMLEKWHYLR